uniref:Uncharacterized protein n=1 Tax=Rhizophora mucronata TaxID=61149 RepID=A0A2P2IYL7_RHIMU
MCMFVRKYACVCPYADAQFLKFYAYENQAKPEKREKPWTYSVGSFPLP